MDFDIGRCCSAIRDIQEQEKLLAYLGTISQMEILPSTAYSNQRRYEVTKSTGEIGDGVRILYFYMRERFLFEQGQTAQVCPSYNNARYEA